MNQPSPIEEQDLSKTPESDLSAPVKTFINQFELLPSSEEKLRAAIGFMRDAISQTGSPYFKEFWEVRKLCIPLFKEEVAPQVRSQLWEEYNELTREGRRLKNLLDEESAFASEQIEIAVKSLEDEIAGFHLHAAEILAKAPSVDFSGSSVVLSKNMDFFQQSQRKLNLLNAYASRINALRKELIKTEMRIRQKNRFFQRLSTLGDQVFPPRKDLIQGVSDIFLKDVESFIEQNFSEVNFNHERVRRSVFHFREEIKTLQSAAKILTLNTQVFSKTREYLSECWDKLKGMEKELKKEFSQQKQKSAENCEQVRLKVQEISQSLQEGTLNIEATLKACDDILRWMRDLELTRNDVKELKDMVNALRHPLEERRDQQENDRRNKELEIEQKRRNQLVEIKEKIENLKDKLASSSAEILEAEVEETKGQLYSFSMTKGERQMLERLLKGIRDQIQEKRERTLLELSEDDRAILDQLRTILEQRKQRRAEIKAQVEEYRKLLGGSTLDCGKAFEYDELMKAEKERLKKMDESIAEIEQKIRALRNK